MLKTDLDKIISFLNTNLKSEFPGGVYDFKAKTTPDNDFINVDILDETDRDLAYSSDLIGFNFFSKTNKSQGELKTKIDKFKNLILGSGKTFNGFTPYNIYQISRGDYILSNNIYHTLIVLRISYDK